MLKLIVHRFRMLGGLFRLRLLQVLEPGERTVGELVQSLERKQPKLPNICRYSVMQDM